MSGAPSRFSLHEFRNRRRPKADVLRLVYLFHDYLEGRANLGWIFPQDTIRAASKAVQKHANIMTEFS